MGLGAGQIVLDTDFASIRSASDDKPALRIYLTSAQSLTDNTLTALSWGSEDFDTHGFHSTSVNPTRITPTIAGLYRIHSSLFLAGATTFASIRHVARKNGSTQVAPSTQWGNMVNSVVSGHYFTCLMEFDGVSDYVEICSLQDNTASAAISAQASNPNITLMEMEYVRASV